MDQNQLGFWKNYEDVINWGYRVSGARPLNDHAPINLETQCENNDRTNSNDEESDFVEDSSVCSEDINLEYLKLCQKTIEHQDKIGKEKRRVDKEYGFCNSQSSDSELSEVIFVEKINPKEVYGSKVNEIECLEAKLQNEFESFCFMKKPVLWPGMAFNLNVPEPEQHLDLRKPSHPS